MLLGMKGCTPQQAAQLVQRFREKHQDTNCAALLSKAKEEGIPRKAHCDSLVLLVPQMPKGEAPPGFPF